MNTTIDKLNGLKNTKQAIKQAIINKGVAVDEAATFASYATKIGEIQAGGGGESEYNALFDIPKKGISTYGSFAECITEINTKGISTTGVTNMKRLFYGCRKLTSLDLSNFDTSKVTNMANMFDQCRSLTSLDLSSFDTSQVTDMQNLFQSCDNLTSIKGLENFDISKCKSLYYMFAYCKSLKSLDLSSFNTDNIIQIEAFYECNSLTTATWGNNWASNPKVMEIDIHYSPLTHDSVLDLFNKLATRDNTPVVKIKGTSYDLMTPDELAIAQNKGWTVTRV